jgi:hypothetical protein
MGLIYLIMFIILYIQRGGLAQSVQLIATGWTVRGSNPGGRGKIFRTRPDRPRGPPSLLYNGYRVFPGGLSGWGVVLTPHPHLQCRGLK